MHIHIRFLCSPPLTLSEQRVWPLVIFELELSTCVKHNSCHNSATGDNT